MKRKNKKAQPCQCCNGTGVSTSQPEILIQVLDSHYKTGEIVRIIRGPDTGKIGTVDGHGAFYIWLQVGKRKLHTMVTTDEIEPVSSQ